MLTLAEGTYTVNEKDYMREDFCGFHDELWKFSLLIDFASQRW